MLRYTLRRILIMIPTLVVISFVTFVIIQLPPGDFLTNQIAELQSQGDKAAAEKAEFLRKQYGLNKPFVEQYGIWIGVWPGENGFSGLLQGDLGWSFEHDLPVKDVVGERLLLSFILNFSVVLMYFANVQFGLSVGGIMDPEYLGQPWSVGKALSVLEHLWIPVIVIGTSGTAGMIRRLRANLLDELHKQYVVTARAKGLAPVKVLWKYPLRMAINPFISDIGNLLPQIVSGAAVVSIVLSLPTTGPMLLDALRSQDMYLAGSFLMFLALLTVVGVLLSDLALAALDPRIRLEGGANR